MTVILPEERYDLIGNTVSYSGKEWLEHKYNVWAVGHFTDSGQFVKLSVVATEFADLGEKVKFETLGLGEECWVDLA